MPISTIGAAPNWSPHSALTRLWLLVAAAVAFAAWLLIPGQVDQAAAQGAVSLSGISVNGQAVVDFDPNHTGSSSDPGYSIGFASGTDDYTVTWTANPSGATVACSGDTGSDPNNCLFNTTDGGTINSTLTVTHGDNSKTYTLRINQGRSGAFQWKASRDIYGMVRTLGNQPKNGRGIWSDGTTLWAVNNNIKDNPGSVGPRLVAFNLSDGSLNSVLEARTRGIPGIGYDAKRPHGITGLHTAAGATIIFADRGNPTSGGTPTAADWHAIIRRDNEWHLNGAYPFNWDSLMQDGDNLGSNSRPDGLWTDGDLFYMVITPDSPNSGNPVSIRVFDMNSSPPGEHLADRMINLGTSNLDLAGMWGDGETLWVADRNDNVIHAYDLATHGRVTSKDFTSTHLSAEGSAVTPWGIWSDGETMWVMGANERIYSFNMPVSTGTRLGKLSVQVGSDTTDLDVTGRTHNVAAGSATSARITIGKAHFDSEILVSPADTNPGTEVHDVDLTGGPQTVTITVTAQDGSTTGTYRVIFGSTPTRPTGVQLIPNSGVLRVTWNAPADSAGISAYDVRYREQGTTNWTTRNDAWVTGGGALSYLISNLSNGQAYEVQVRAENSIGPGDWTASAVGTPAVSVSLDAKLADLRVNGETVPHFDADDGEYAVGVASTLTTATVTWTAGASATVTCTSDSDSDPSNGCQVALTQNARHSLTLNVNEGTNFGNYTISINRGRGGDYRWKAENDIYWYGDLSAETSQFGRGMWSDGTTLWVGRSSPRPAKLFAFNLATGLRDADKDVALEGSSRFVQGITGFGGMAWIGNAGGNADATKKVNGYRVDEQGNWTRASSLDLDGIASNSDSRRIHRHGLATDGEILWSAFDVDHGVDEEIMALDLLSGGEDDVLNDRGIPASALTGNSYPGGLWTDGVTLWVTDITDKMIYAYDLETRTRDTSREFSSSNLAVANGEVAPWGIWSDGATMWVLAGTEYIYSFNLPASDHAELRHFRADGEDISGFDPGLSTQTLALPNDATSFTLDTRARQKFATMNITSADADTQMDGHQVELSSSEWRFTATVTAQDGNTSKDYAITLGRLPNLVPGANVSLTAAERSLVVTWTAPTDAGTSSINRYDVRYIRTTHNSLRNESLYNTYWHVIDDAWISGNPLTYTITGLGPADSYYVQVRAWNSSGAGKWLPFSRYRESPSAQPIVIGSENANLSALTITPEGETTPATLSPTFAVDRFSYMVDIGKDVEYVTVAATLEDATATVTYLSGNSGGVELEDHDDQRAGFQVEAPDDGESKWFRVRVTAENEVATQTYAVRINREARSTVASLSSVSFGDPALDALLNFRPSNLNYTVNVDQSVREITLTATAQENGVVSFLTLVGATCGGNLEDANSTEPGLQVEITASGSRFCVRARSEGEQNGVHNTRDYKFVVSRSVPTVSVTAPEGKTVSGEQVPFVEGDQISFTISVDSVQSEDLEVAYSYWDNDTTTSDFLPGTTPIEGTATVPSGQTSVIVNVTTTNNAEFTGNQHTLRFWLSPSPENYQLHGTGQVEREFRDDDFTNTKTATFVLDLTVDDDEPTEGSTITATVSLFAATGFGTVINEYGVSFAIQVLAPTDACQDCEATAGVDYEETDVEVRFAGSDFEEATISSASLGNNLDGLLAEHEVEIPIAWDAEMEDEETFKVGFGLTGDEAGYNVFDDSPFGGATITIQPSTAASSEAHLGSLSISPATLVPAFDTDTTIYTASVANTVTQVRLLAAPADTDAFAVQYLDADDMELGNRADNPSGVDVTLAAGDNVFKVVVTAEDRSTTLTYTVTITRSLPSVATLSSLTLSPGTLSPAFSSARTSYTANLQSSVTEITLTAAASDSLATVQFLDKDDNPISDADANTAGHQVDVVEGDNLIKVVVTAQDGETTQTYTLTATVLSDKPQVSIVAPSGTFTEGDEVVYTVRMTRALTTGLTIFLNVAEDGDVVEGSFEGRQFVSMPTGTTSATYTVRTMADTDWEAHSTVTVSVQPSSQYTVSSAQGSAETLVNDDDFPQSDVTVGIDPSDGVDEGQSATIKVTVSTPAGQEPHRDSGFLLLSTADVAGSNAATAGDDYTEVSERRFNLLRSRFAQVDANGDDVIDDNDPWQAEYTTTVQTINDNDPEGEEVFEVELSHDTSSEQHAKLTLPASPAAVMINTSDFAAVNMTQAGSATVEGDAINLTFTRSGQVADSAVTINFEVAETGDMLGAGAGGRQSVTIAAQQSTATYSVVTDDDNAWEAGSTITIRLLEGSQYTVGSSALVSEALLDNDFPAATAAISVSASTVEEGESLTVTLTITTDANQIPNRGTGQLSLTTRSGTATQGTDFPQFSQRPSFQASDFTEVDVDETVSGEDLRQQATRTWTVSTTDDTTPEGDEGFSIALATVTGGANPTATNLSLDSAASELSVQINANDLPMVSVESSGPQVEEGGEIEYTVARSVATSDPLTVNLTVLDPSGLTAANESGARTVTIPGGQASVTVTIPTSTDTTWDPHGDVTVVVGTGAGYNVDETAARGVREVRDNDFPDATVSMLDITSPIEEGYDKEARLVFLTDGDQEPHKGTGEFTLEHMPGTADATVGNVKGDYKIPFVFISVELFELEGETFSEFERVDIDDRDDVEDWRWQAIVRSFSDVEIIDDEEEEGEETFTLTIAQSELGDPIDPNITIVSPGVITIAASDVSDDSEDATLSALSLSAGTLDPIFERERYEYHASVPYSDSQLTVTLTLNDATATPTYRKGTSGRYSTITGGSFQVNLDEGRNTIEILVTAEDDRYTQTYSVVVTREPQVSITTKTTGTVTEGEEIVFTVTLSRHSEVGLTVNLNVLDTGNVLDQTQEGPQTVEVPAYQRSVDYTVTTTDNQAFSAASKVEVRVAAGDGYTAHSSAASAEKAVQENDFPDAEASLSVDLESLIEGSSLTATVTIVTDTNVLQASVVGPGTVYANGSTTASATPGVDYTPERQAFTFSRSDFALEDIDDAPNVTDERWVARKTARFHTTNDSDTENDEQLQLKLERSVPNVENPTPLHQNVRFSPTESTARVLIVDNDSDDSSLSALTITADGEPVGHLTPRFLAGTTQYSAGVGNAISEITISATATDSNARILLRGGTASSSATQVASATRTTGITEGETILTALVTAQNNSSQEYRITLTRAQADQSLSPSSSDAEAVYPATVTYELVFRGDWDSDVTPGGVPAGAHFTTLIGGIHNADVKFLEAGQLASDGVERMAEVGATSTLRGEVQTAIDTAPNNALSVVEVAVGGGPKPTTDPTSVELNSQYPRLTLTSMIAPTHDWFVGVSGFSLLDSQGRWLRNHTINLYPWDAGTEDGTDFSLVGNDTDPPEPIRSLQGIGPFTLERIASIELELDSIRTRREIDEDTGAANVGAPVRSPVEPPAGSGTVSYELAGTDANSFEINAGTGQLRTKASETYDYEEREWYELTVIATDSGPDPAVVDNIRVRVQVNNVDEPGVLTVSPETVTVDVMLTARLSDPDIPAGESPTNVTWTWERSPDGSSNWTTITGAAAATYMVDDPDEDQYLRVTISYDDPHGLGKSASYITGQVGESTLISTDSSLSGLALSGVSIGTFASSTFDYTASVGYTVATTTVTAAATAADDGATVRVSVDGGSSKELPAAGEEVALAIGESVITLTVTAENGSTTDYTVTVTRDQPTVTVSAPAATLVEGEAIPFLISRSEAAADELVVTVGISEDGAMIPASDPLSHSVTIQEDQTSVRLEIASDADTDWEAASEITASIATDEHYTIGTPSSATQTVADNDFPESTATLSVTTLEGEDDGPVRATVTILTAAEQEPHKDAGQILLTTTAGTATTSDFTPLTASTGLLSFAQDDFTVIDLDGNPDTTDDMRYRASKYVEIAITDDSDDEFEESFTVSMSRVETGGSPTDEHVSFDDNATSRTVTIPESDLSDVSSLSALTLSDGPITFDPDTTSYSTFVPFAVQQVTVTPRLEDSTATLSFFDSADNRLTEPSSSPTPYAWELEVGPNTLEMKVVAQDGSGTTYTVIITRQAAALTVTAASEATEGEPVVLTIERDGSVSTATQVELNLTEVGAMAVPGDLGVKQLEIAAGTSTTSYTLNTVDDADWEQHAQITAELTLAGATEVLSRETIQILDNDFPAATAELTAAPTLVEEDDGEFTVRLTVTTDNDEQPHKGSGTIRLATESDTATPADYGTLSSANANVSFDADDFMSFDDNGSMRWRATHEFALPVVDDSDKEEEEIFRLVMSAVDSGTDATDPQIEFPSSPMVELRIAKSDLSSDAKLSDVELSAGELGVQFDPGQVRYAASVPFANEQITIDFVARSSDATVEVYDDTADPTPGDPGTPLDDDTTVEGIQVDLDLNTPIVVRAVVTAEDGDEVVSYEFTITRLLPELQISIPDGPYVEGDAVVATISRNGSPSNTTSFRVTLTETPVTGGMVDPAVITEFTDGTHIIQANQESLEISIPTLQDEDWDETSTITVELLENEAYSTVGATIVTSVVSDNDFPVSTATLTLDASVVDEGNAVNGAVTIRADSANQQPHKDAGQLRLTTSDGPDPDGTGPGAPALGGSDYTVIDTTPSFSQADFSQDAEGYWQASIPITVQTTDDNVAEDMERFTVSLSTVTTGADQTDTHISLGASELTIDLIASDLGTEVGLSGIELRPGELVPAFVSTTFSYSVALGFEHPLVTITPESLRSGDTIAFISDRTDPTTEIDDASPAAGFQYDLGAAGSESVVFIRVIPSDSATPIIYELAFTRSLPVVSIAWSGDESQTLAEGDDVDFEISLNGPAGGTGLAVGLDVAGVPRTVTVPAGDDSVEYRITTDDDTDWEAHFDTTVTVSPSTDSTYTVAPDANTVTVTVHDNDFPEASAELAVRPEGVVEGMTASATLTITTDRDELPHKDAGAIMLATTTDMENPNGAEAGVDYQPLTASTGRLVFGAELFSRVNLGDDTTPDWRYRAFRTAPIRILDENDQEPEEQFTVTVNAVTEGNEATDGNISLLNGAEPISQIVSILESDIHQVTSIDVSLLGDGAELTVGIDNPSSTPQTLHVRWREASATTWDSDDAETVENTRSTSVSVSLDGLGRGMTFDVEASLDEMYPEGRTVTATIVTLPETPAVSSIVFKDISRKGATAEVTLSNLVSGQEETVRLRYRAEGVTDWPELLVGTPATEAQDTFPLTDLEAGTTYEVQATLATDFTGALQTYRFTTDPPVVAEVSSKVEDIQDTEAKVVVNLDESGGAGALRALFGLNGQSRGSGSQARSFDQGLLDALAIGQASIGDTVYLRFRPLDDWWKYESPMTIEEDRTFVEFDLNALIPATTYEVEASYDFSFLDPAQIQCLTFVTASVEDAKDARVTSTDCGESAPSTSSSVGGGGFGGGGGGGGAPPREPVPSDLDFEWNVALDIEALDREHDQPTGLWSDGRMLWILNNAETGADRVFAYRLVGDDIEDGEDGEDIESGNVARARGDRDEAAEFTLDRRNRFSQGLWSDGVVVWVADSGQDLLFAYALADGRRMTERDIELHERNQNPRGIWSDGETMYVLDSVARALFAYDLESGELQHEFALNGLNRSPRGLWSDGVAFWVSDDGAKRLFAYRIENTDNELALVRHEDEEFSFRLLISAGNSNPRGIWSDGAVIYVADVQDDKVYSYNLPDAIDARLIELSLTGVAIGPFSPLRGDYVGEPDAGATAATVTPTPAQATATVVIAPADGSPEVGGAYRVTIGRQGEIVVSVTSPDGSRTRVYRVRLGDPPSPSCLNGLGEQRLSEVTFGGGSIESLGACLRQSGLRAVFYWTGEHWLIYAPSFPDFLSRGFVQRFSAGIPVDTRLIAARPDSSQPPADGS